jgi:DNA-binding response OmpR family regulator
MASPIILVVEDDPLIATLLPQVLANAGYRVLSAQNGTEALSLGRIHRGEITLLLCDVALEDRCGPSVARQLEEFSPRMSTIFTSGYPLDILAERHLLTPEILEAERTWYLPKPFRPKQLLQLVGSVLSRPQAVAAAGLKQHGVAHGHAAAY